MTRRLLRSSLGCLVLLLLVNTAYAQEAVEDTTRYYQYYRASESLFFQGRLGLNFYGGDRDVNPFDEVQGYIENIGFDLGLEVGYHFSDRFSLSLMHLSGRYPRIEDEPFTPVADYPGALDLDPETTSKWRHHFSLLGRVQILPLERVSPYYHMGFNVSFGKINDEMEMGIGPTIGVGLDAAVTDRMGIFVEIDGIYSFDDGALDLADTQVFEEGSSGRGIDASDFDAFPFLGFGLRYNLKSPLIPIVLDCTSPGTLRIDEAGTFAATTNEATRPITYEWDFGDGASGTGILTSHAYSAAGDYMATVTATNRAGSVSANCPVTVLAPPTCEISAAPSTLSMCQQPLQAVQFRSTVTGDPPISYSWDFGDGNTSTQAEPTHTYTRLDANQNTTTNTATLTVTNEAGSAMCTATVTIEPCACVSNLVLAQVVYDRNESILREGQTMENLQNNVEILRNSP
ncbi:MAG TPA: PKD domain-containing protein, partial [Rhodothermales bacterium]|nr:PKD domain-containing protein [Rhodothermales bacterium]